MAIWSYRWSNLGTIQISYFSRYRFLPNFQWSFLKTYTLQVFWGSQSSASVNNLSLEWHQDSTNILYVILLFVEVALCILKFDFIFRWSVLLPIPFFWIMYPLPCFVELLMLIYIFYVYHSRFYYLRNIITWILWDRHIELRICITRR